MYQGFVKVMAATPIVRVADCQYNAAQIILAMRSASELKVEVVCFPELSITGYSCMDLFSQQILTDEALSALHQVLKTSEEVPNLTAIVGLPVMYEGLRYDCALVLKGGDVLGVVPKANLTTYDGTTMRCFAPGRILPKGARCEILGKWVPFGTDLLFECNGFRFAVEIGHDLWSVASPSCTLVAQGADVVFNPSADSERVGFEEQLSSWISMQSKRHGVGYVYVGCGHGESTQDEVFAGRTYIAENGSFLATGEPYARHTQLTTSEIDIERIRNIRWRTNNRDEEITAYPMARIVDGGRAPHSEMDVLRHFNPLPFVPTEYRLEKRCREVIAIQSEGLLRRVEHTHAQSVVLGISGGLDSTLALLVCVRTFDIMERDRKNIIGVTMPGFGTTDRTYNNAMALMNHLGITIREISIRKSCEQHFEDIGHDVNQHNVVYENAQARERTQILMDIANQTNGLVVGTGDLSELALGWATYNGDHMSMYGVNAGVPKTLIKHVVAWAANALVYDETCRDILLDIIATPISPELIPTNEAGEMQQKTEDLVGPYELHDFFLYHTLRHGFRPTKLYFMAKKAFDGTDKRVAIYSDECIKHWLTNFFKRFFMSQFKRNTIPDGPKMGSCSFSTRCDWRMPSDAFATAWLDECKAL